MNCFRKKKHAALSIAPVLFLIAVLFQMGFPHGSAHSSSEGDVVVGTADRNIVINKSQLDKLVGQYLLASRKNEVTPDERVQLVKNAIRRRLILQQDSVEALRKDPSIQSMVKEYEDNLIIARFLEQNVGKNLTADEKEVREYYDANRYKFSTPPKVDASHILVRTREEAETVLKKLHEGQDFAQLAKQYSIDLPMALEGGKMGTIEKGRTLPELDKALFSLAKGETSDIVETRFGFHILRVDEVYPPSFKSFDEVKDEARKAVLREKESKAYDAMARTLEQNAHIKIFEDRIGATKAGEKDK